MAGAQAVDPVTRRVASCPPAAGSACARSTSTTSCASARTSPSSRSISRELHGRRRTSARVLERVRRDYPVALHGVSMSLGSAEPLDRDYLRAPQGASSIASRPRSSPTTSAGRASAATTATTSCRCRCTEEAARWTAAKIRDGPGCRSAAGSSSRTSRATSSTRASELSEVGLPARGRRGGRLRHPARRQQPLRQRAQPRPRPAALPRAHPGRAGRPDPPRRPRGPRRRRDRHARPSRRRTRCGALYRSGRAAWIRCPRSSSGTRGSRRFDVVLAEARRAEAILAAAPSRNGGQRDRAAA